MGTVTVMGAGAWGIAFALRCHATGQQVRLWARDPAVVATMRGVRQHPRLLPGVTLPADIDVTADAAAALAGADLVVVAIPSVGLTDQLRRWGAAVPSDATVASLTKGFDAEGARTPSAAIIDELDCASDRVVVVSGPNLASEVAAGRPSATVAACPGSGRAEIVQAAATSDAFRVYTNPDRVGVELAGIVKNVLAIVAGAAQGRGLGDNTTAMVVTRGLAELTRLGVAVGADALTFQGLAGIGDLVATCTAAASRNRTFGERLGRGEPVARVLEDMGPTVEGVRSAPQIAALADRHGVDMPMVRAVVAVTRDGADVDSLAAALLARRPGAELPAAGLRGGAA